MGETEYSFINLRPSSLNVFNVVTIRPDGSVELAEGLSLDAASTAFWRAVVQASPGFLASAKDSNWTGERIIQACCGIRYGERMLFPKGQERDAADVDQLIALAKLGLQTLLATPSTKGASGA